MLMKYKKIILAAIPVLILSAAVPECFGEAAWLWHGGNIDPRYPTQSHDTLIRVKIGYQYFIDNVAIYLTYDGTEPQGAYGEPFIGEVIPMSWDYTEWDQDAELWADWWSGIVPAAAGHEIGTAVNYKIGAWHSGGGAERFADNYADNSYEADVFSFRICGEVQQALTEEEVIIEGTVYIEGVTDEPGPAAGLDVEIWTNYGEEGVTDWRGIQMSYCEDVGESERYSVELTPGTAGIFKYLVRYRLDLGEWQYQGDPDNELSMCRLIVNPVWLKDKVFYEVFPRVHNAEDVNGDGYLSNDEFGGFKNVLNDLDRLEELGVGVLWLMPIHPLSTNPEHIKSTDGMFGSPYAPKDYLAVNPDYGTEEDLHELVDAAHAREMKVFTGFVPNHLSPDNVLLNPFNPPENGGYHPEWFEQDEFGDPRPDLPEWSDTVALNYDCNDQENMRAFVVSALAHWLDEFDIDGYRCDMAYFQPLDFWTDAFETLRENRPDFAFLAEAYDLEYDLERAGFGAVYDHTFYRSVFHELRNGSMDADGLRSRLLNMVDNHARGFLPFRYIDNHDEERAAAAFGDANKPVTALIMTMRGAPMLYSGQEAALTERIPLFRGWNDVELYPYLDFENDPDFTEWMKTLIHFRNGNPALRRGEEYLLPSSSNHIFALLRRFQNKSVLVGCNLDVSNGLPRSGNVQIPEQFNLETGIVYSLQDIFTLEKDYVLGQEFNSYYFQLPENGVQVMDINELCEWGGDVNDDGAVDDKDDMLILQQVCGLFELEETENCRGDYNVSGEADIADIIEKYEPAGTAPENVELMMNDVQAMPGETVTVIVTLDSAGVAGGVVQIEASPADIEPVSWLPGETLTEAVGASGIDPCPPDRNCNTPEPAALSVAQFVHSPTDGEQQDWFHMQWAVPTDAIPGTEFILDGETVMYGPNGNPIPSAHIGPGSILVTGGPNCTETGVTLSMPAEYFSPGDDCRLDAFICNMEGQTLENCIFFCLLDVYGAYWFYPSWSAGLDGVLLDTLPPGQTDMNLISPFQWPEITDSAEGLHFYGALVLPNLSDLIGKLGIWEFGYGADD